MFSSGVGVPSRAGLAHEMGILFNRNVRLPISNTQTAAPELDMWEIGVQLLGMLSDAATAIMPSNLVKEVGKIVIIDEADMQTSPSPSTDTLHVFDIGPTAGYCTPPEQCIQAGIPPNNEATAQIHTGSWASLAGVDSAAVGCCGTLAAAGIAGTVLSATGDIIYANVVHVKTYTYTCIKLKDGTIQRLLIANFAGIWWYKDDMNPDDTCGAGGSMGNWVPFSTLEVVAIGPCPVGYINKPGDLMAFSRRRGGRAGPGSTNLRAAFVSLCQALLPNSSGNVMARCGSLPLVLLAILLNRKTDAPEIQSVLVSIAFSGDGGAPLANLINQFLASFPEVIFDDPDNNCEPPAGGPWSITKDQVDAALKWLKDQSNQEWANENIDYPMAQSDPNTGDRLMPIRLTDFCNTAHLGSAMRSAGGGCGGDSADFSDYCDPPNCVDPDTAGCILHGNACFKDNTFCLGGECR